ncbi:CLIP-associating protein [Drosophila busckii]|uniref:CLIP-associating protein n=1 Tax=Drosophila busckii TaxID=30019 RepID=UPI00143297F0|nr:CLIP-associating protein [Drosophila busckii]
MAYRKPSDLDGFIQQMPKADMRVKVQLAEDLVTFLSDDTNSIVCTDMGFLIDNLMPWLTGSHFKIAQKSLEAFSELIKHLGSDFNAYTATVLPHVIDRLGDSRDTVREKAQLLLRDLMEHKVLTAQLLVDKLAASCFKHKNAKVREEFLQTIVNTLHEYGTQQLSVRVYIAPVCALLGDPTVNVREAAIQTLVEIYKHVGDRLRPDLRRIEDMPASKLALLEQKFDQVKQEGLLLPSAQRNGNGHGLDEADNIAVRERVTKIVKRPMQSAMSTLRQKPTPNEAASGDAGAVTMEIFEASFEQVPQLNIFHQKDMDDIYKQIVLIISDKNSDWEKRVDAFKKLRALLISSYHTQPQFLAVQLKDLSLSFLDVLKEELRSQVIREACITIAYMSKTLRNKLDAFAWSILEQLIQLIQNSAKVIASASMLALKYIIKYTHAPKLLKIYTDMLQQSKSKDIRASLCEVLVLLLEEWQTKSLERHAIVLRDTLKKSIGDADSEARRHSRLAYWAYRRHFPELADQIYGTLDIAAQRALERERDGGSGGINGSQQSLVDTRRTVAPSRIGRSQLQKPAVSMRSISAVDTAAAQRAKARAQYTLYTRQKKPLGTSNSINSTPAQGGSSGCGSLPRPRLNSSSHNASSSSPGTVTPSPRIGRPRAGVSQSQPGSRSTSPSTKLRDPYGMGSYYRGGGGAIPKKASGIPRSTASSRETSPNRSGGGGLMKRSLYTTGSSSRRTPERNNPVRSTAASRLLAQSREAEQTLGSEVDALADYTSGDFMRSGGGLRNARKLGLARDESDDVDSEASSVCSERSFDSSYTRGNSNSNYSLSGSRNRLDWSTQRAPFEDIDTIIQYCASTHWSERKDGLISLTQYLADGKILTSHQLQCVLDMFRKMFMDTHTKVYSLFLDTVTELILVHAHDLQDWLFILLTRLFNKLGTDLLNSMHSKIWKVLQVVHEYFPPQLQLKELFRIISDNTQTPTTKTRIAILRFLTDLANTYCKSSDFPSDQSLSCERTVLKLAQLSTDQKSMELRSQARVALIALYNLNTPQMTKLLTALPKGCQDTARLCIQSNLRRQSSGANSPSSSPLSSSSPKPLQSPSVGPFASLNLQTLNSSPRSRQSSVEQELLYGQCSELELQHSIQKTSEQIRNCFSSEQYHSLAPSANGYNGHHLQFTAMDQQLAQQDSLSSNSKTQSSANTTQSNTPESATMRLDAAPVPPPAAININIAPNGELILPNNVYESEVVRVALTLSKEQAVDQLQLALTNLGMCIRGGNCELPNKHFKSIMRMLLNMLEAEHSDVVIAGLQVLKKIVRSDKMRHNWLNFLELILLKIINCYQHSKEALREIDGMIPRLAPALPLDLTINIVNPVIATGAFPANLCAIKLLLEVTEHHGTQLTDAHLDAVFPNLARSADDMQSMVRKAAVFCIVKLYIVMGEDKLKPKLSVMNPSKVRLLNVYIEKQRNSMAGGSTKNSSAASSS